MNHVPLRVRGLAYLIERCGVQLEKWPAESILRLGRRVAEPLPRWALNYYIERHSEWYGDQLHSEWYDDQLEKWPVERLLRLARWIAEPLRLGWCPGWHYKFRAWSVDPHADHLGRLRWWLWQHFASISEEYSFVMTWYCDLRIWIYLGNDISWTMFVGTGYEPNEFAYLATILKPGMTFIDVGANEGLYTSFASRWVGPQGKVIAMEPSSREYRRLGRNLKLNRAQNVLTLPVAASDKYGEAILRIAGCGHEGFNTLGDVFLYDATLARTETVRLVPLDDVVHGAKIDKVDVIKIDVEGAELAVLRGARSILSRDHPILLLELNDRTLRHQGAASDEVLQLLREHGYQMFIFDQISGRPVSGEIPPEEDANIVAVPLSRSDCMHDLQH